MGIGQEDEDGNGAAAPNGDRLATRARELVLANYASDEGCSTARIARALGVSRSLICHHYRSAYGATIGHDIRRLRIDQALHLLSNDPSRLVKEVAAEVGFKQASYRTFLNAFRAETGMTPTEYQKRTALGTFAEPHSSQETTAALESRRRRADGSRGS